MRVSVLGALLASMAFVWAANAAEREELINLQAPLAASRLPLEAGSKPQALKFARAIVRTRPDPWARVEIWVPEGANPVEYATWSEGRDRLDPATVAAVFDEEASAAGIPVHGTAQSVFADESPSDLQVGLSVIDMKGRFCRGCGWSTPQMSWVGAVTMTARWEIYSQLQGKVVATIETSGGFTAPKKGLAGDPERLIHEAIRDNVRRLVADETFRRVITSEPVLTTTAVAQPIRFIPQRLTSIPLSQASNGVVTIFAGEALGSGALVSTDGYILTNHHVAGTGGRVRVRWPDGTDTVGEVVRGDRRRDVALIKTTPRSAALPIRSTPAQVGETVFAVGTPLRKEFSSTMTRGVISATRLIEGQTMIQSDVAVDHGNSGGPLLDEQGRIIALTVSRYEEGGGGRSINFFIPIDDALRALALTPAS